MEEKTKYQAIDAMKYIAALLVIAVHSDTLLSQPELNFFIKNIVCRIAVPFFFVSSAFFIRQGMKKNSNYLRNYLKGLTTSYLGWSVIFIPLGLDWIHQNVSVPAHILPIALIVGLLNVGTYYHLWYVPALIFSLWAVAGLLKRFSYPVIFAGTFFFYLFGSLETYYGLLSEGWLKRFFDTYISLLFTTRNGLLFGMVFVLIGFFLYDYRNKLAGLASYAPLLTLLFGGLLALEGMLIYNAHRLNMNFLILLLPLSFFLCLWLLTSSLMNNRDTSTIREWSKHYYFVHPICIILVEENFKAFDLQLPLEGVVRFLCSIALTHFISLAILHSLKQPMKVRPVLGSLLFGGWLTLILAGLFFHFKASTTVVTFELVPCFWLFSSLLTYAF